MDEVKKENTAATLLYNKNPPPDHNLMYSVEIVFLARGFFFPVFYKEQRLRD